MNRAHEVRMEFADAMDDALTTLVSRVVERATIGVQHYEYLRDLGDSSLSTNTAQLLGQFAQGVRDIEAPLDADRLSYKLALERAQMGLPLSSILRAYQVAGEVLWEWFAEQVRERKLPTTSFENVWPVWLRFVDVITRRAVEAYTDWERSRSQEQRHAERRIMMGVIRADLDELDGRRTLQLLGLDLERGLALSIVRATPLPEQLDTDLVSRVERAVRSASESRAVIAVRESDILVLHVGDNVDSGQKELWLASTLRGIPNCFGATSRTVRTMRDLYGEVHRTDLAARAAAFSRVIALAQDVSMIDHALVALDSAGLVPVFVTLLDSSEGVRGWRDTVVAWAEGSWRPSQAARNLGVHQNTIYYRLAQIESKTGLDLRDSKQAMSLYLAARLKKAQGVRTQNLTP